MLFLKILKNSLKTLWRVLMANCNSCHLNTSDYKSWRIIFSVWHWRRFVGFRRWGRCRTFSASRETCSHFIFLFPAICWWFLQQNEFTRVNDESDEISLLWKMSSWARSNLPGSCRQMVQILLKKVSGKFENIKIFEMRPCTSSPR